MRLELKLVLLAAAVFAPGCGEEEPPIGPTPPGDLLVGSADFAGEGFVEVADGAEVALVAGAQGGFHVWTSFQVRGAAGELYLRREARRVSDGVLILRALPLYFEVPEEAMESWWAPRSATPSFMCPSPIGIKVFDDEIAFSVELTDRRGNLVAEDHVVVIPRCPQDDQREWCLQICSG
jgi:hypothetical protein